MVDFVFAVKEKYSLKSKNEDKIAGNITISIYETYCKASS